MALRRGLHPNNFNSFVPAALITHQLSCRDAFNDLFGSQAHFLRNSDQLPLFDICSAILSSFLNIHKPNYNASGATQGEQEWEAHPVVIRRVDNGLYHVRTDDARLHRKSAY
jgi:hypothetical protein